MSKQSDEQKRLVEKLVDLTMTVEAMQRRLNDLATRPPYQASRLIPEDPTANTICVVRPFNAGQASEYLGADSWEQRGPIVVFFRDGIPLLRNINVAEIRSIQKYVPWPRTH